MKKRYIIFSLCVIMLGLFIGSYQYVQNFQAEMVGAAYSMQKPANGHSWDEMECTAGLCVTGDNKVGMGTDNPTEKLEVVGNLKVSGDICNSQGNCLSALATLTNACGTAATNYAYSASAYSGTYCMIGNPTPATPAFPNAGASATWTCPVMNGSPISCTATRSPPAIPLVYSVHTEWQCTNAGGSVVASDTSLPLCRFGGSSCPSGWYWYKGFSTVDACGYYQPGGGCWGNGTYRYFGGHAWADDPSGHGAVYPYTYYQGCGGEGCCNYDTSCTTFRSQIGCY